MYLEFITNQIKKKKNVHTLQSAVKKNAKKPKVPYLH